MAAVHERFHQEDASLARQHMRLYGTTERFLKLFDQDVGVIVAHGEQRLLEGAALDAGEKIRKFLASSQWTPPRC